jgi:hypothetical protein
MWYWFATSEDSIVNLPAALKTFASHITWCPEAAFFVVQKLLELSTCKEITFPLKSVSRPGVGAVVGAVVGVSVGTGAGQVLQDSGQQSSKSCPQLLEVQ